MKTDLDDLMNKSNIDVILVTGSAMHNPAMYYLTGGGHLTRADLFKKRGEKPILFYQPMEREEAARTGLKTKSLDDYDLRELIKKANGDANKARVLLYKKILEELEIDSGRMIVYGKMDAGQAYTILSRLQTALPGLMIFPESGDPLLSKAMLTKDSSEISLIQDIGKITVEVVGRVAEYLVSQKASNGILMRTDGHPVTIGDVKQKINLWLAELGAENPEQTIFSIGHDAGVPHSAGNPDDLLELGKTIIFDIYPCLAGGGYFYDLTRTWCLGYAPDDVYRLYEDVCKVFNQVKVEMKMGSACQIYQKRTCELFEAQGHLTIQNTPKTLDGYVHSLGHGVGLNIHERPWFSENVEEEDRIIPGVVFTIEPGLYYPDQGMGVRIEDTVWVTPDGSIDPLAFYPYDLVLPVKV
jgi:Xaa-Pro aminopeptidase